MNKVFDVCFHQIEMKVAAIQTTTQFWNTTVHEPWTIVFILCLHVSLYDTP